jgi:hypothetical protein
VGKKKKNKHKASESHPTHLAGVPLPADLREIAAVANQLVKNPVVRDVITAGVFAAIAALAENETVRRTARNAGEDAEDAAEGAVRRASRAKVALKAAAGAMGKRLLDDMKAGSGKSGKKAGKSARQEANGREPAAAQ